jgi:transposase
MSDLPVRLSPIPSDTARATKAVFNLTNAYLIVGDQAEQWLRDVDLTDQSAASPRSAMTRIRLAFITIFQFVEDLPDRLGADAVRTRMDWKYALHLPLNSTGFDDTLLSEYRQHLSRDLLDWRLLQHLIEQVAAIGLLPLTERQDIVVADVLVSVSNLSRIEDLLEAMHAALMILAARQPDWLRSNALPHWYERYTPLPAHHRLPHDQSKQENLAQAIGEDATHLLTAIDHAHLTEASDLAEICLLRKVCQQQFVIQPSAIHWRALQYDVPTT